MTECPCDREKTIDPWCAAAGMCAREDEEEVMTSTSAPWHSMTVTIHALEGQLERATIMSGEVSVARELKKDDAALIVKAVNHHDELVAALRELVGPGGYEAVKRGHDLLAKLGEVS